MLKKYILFALLAAGQLSAETIIRKEEPKKTLTHGQKVVIYGTLLGGSYLLGKGMGHIIYPLLPTSISPTVRFRIALGICFCTIFAVAPGEKQMDKIMSFFEEHRDWLFF